jgi:hypothetical protein
MEKQSNIQWQPIIELSIVLFTILGSTVPLYLHTDAKFESHRNETNQILTAIREDIRDFHGRLCSIEERNKK